MISDLRQPSAWLPLAVAPLVLGTPIVACAQTHDARQPEQIAAHSFVFSNAANDLLVQTEPHATLVVGVQDPALVAQSLRRH